jgi:hypothetical protein
MSNFHYACADLVEWVEVFHWVFSDDLVSVSILLSQILGPFLMPIHLDHPIQTLKLFFEERAKGDGDSWMPAVGAMAQILAPFMPRSKSSQAPTNSTQTLGKK